MWEVWLLGKQMWEVDVHFNVGLDIYVEVLCIQYQLQGNIL